MSTIDWRSARVKGKEKKQNKIKAPVKTTLPLKPLSVICFEDLVMSGNKKQRYFKHENDSKAKKAKKGIFIM